MVAGIFHGVIEQVGHRGAQFGWIAVQQDRLAILARVADAGLSRIQMQHAGRQVMAHAREFDGFADKLGEIHFDVMALAAFVADFAGL